MASATSSQQQQPQPQQQPQHQPDFHNTSNHVDHTNYTTNENQLAGLVEAATAAADQDVSDWAAAAAAAAAAGNHQLENFPTELHLPDDGFGEGGFGSLSASTGTGRQTRGSLADGQTGQGLSRAVSKKRKRGDEVLDPALTGVAEQDEQQHHAFDESEFRGLTRQQSLTDARAVGVHSAAALFRQPSGNKKYTRPPMSRLFASLELSPENFLHLQAAAKSYMLDDNHPDRRDCVGQRGKGDTEMVKLRLWNCVCNFLENEGYGERFFGEHVVNDGMPPRQYIWPRDQHKIIALVIPLLRRMVTNERQRKYAVETRKCGPGPGGSNNISEDRKRRKTEESISLEQTHQDSQHQQQSQTQVQQQNRDDQHRFVPPPPIPQYDISTSGDHMNVGLSPLVLDGYSTNWDEVSKSYNMYNQDYQLDTLWGVSGLQQPDWLGLVAAVDSHYQVIHNGNATECAPSCGDKHLENIISSNELTELGWRIGGSANAPARSEFASSVTRDVDRIIRENLLHRQECAIQDQTDDHGLSQAPWISAMHQSAPYGSGPAQDHRDHSDERSPITLRFNVIQESKRVVPRLDVTAEQCPDLASVRNFLAQRLSGQLPLSTCDGNGNVVTTGWKIQVWLPEGLVAAENDGDWTIAQLSAGTIDWMDSDLRVIVDIGENRKNDGTMNT